MESYGSFYYLDGNIFRTDSTDDIAAGEVSFYEVIRTRKGVPLFFDDHIKRLNDGISTRYVLKEDIYDVISEGVDTLVSKELYDEINIRITVTFTGQDYSIHICYVASSFPTEEMIHDGVRLILYHAERFDPSVKILNNRLRLSVNEELSKKKAYEALLVNRDNYITEGSKSNIFFITADEVLFTAPDSMVLSGITRKYVTDICKREGIDIVYQACKVSEISQFPSVFITGTSPAVMPVKSIDGHCYEVNSAIIDKLRLVYQELMEESINKYLLKKKGY
jgi:branched-chain amino acid aminotransferase